MVMMLWYSSIKDVTIRRLAAPFFQVCCVSLAHRLTVEMISRFCYLNISGSLKPLYRCSATIEHECKKHRFVNTWKRFSNVVFQTICQQDNEAIPNTPVTGRIIVSYYAGNFYENSAVLWNFVGRTSGKNKHLCF